MRRGNKLMFGVAVAALVLVAAAINLRQIHSTVTAPRLVLASTTATDASFSLEYARLSADQIKKLAYGTNFTLILLHDGRLFAGGMNDSGQVGIGNQEVVLGKLYQVPFPDGRAIRDVDVGDGHSLALDDRGSVWAWGSNLSGQIGDGSNRNRNEPYKAMDDAREIAAGYRFSGAVSKDGQLWAWGMDCDKADPAYQQLLVEFAANAAAGGYYYGGSDVAGKQDCLNEQNLPIASRTPRRIETGGNIEELTAGYGHFVWRTADGQLWDWGCNAFAQLGREKTFNNEGTRIPGRVSLPDGVVPAQVSAGLRHTAMLDSQGRVWAWGHNATTDTGIRNDGDPQKFLSASANPGQPPAPVVARPVQVDLGQAGRVVSVTAGFDGTVALLEDGRLLGMGANNVRRFTPDNAPAIEAPRQLAERVAVYGFAREAVNFIQTKAGQ